MRHAIIIGLIVVIAGIAVRIIPHHPSQPKVAHQGDAVSPNDQNDSAARGHGAVDAGGTPESPMAETRAGVRRALPSAKLRTPVRRNRSIAQKEPGATTEGVANAEPPNATPEPTPPLLAAPMARTALSFVGTVPEAELVWVAAINDPTVPPQ